MIRSSKPLLGLGKKVVARLTRDDVLNRLPQEWLDFIHFPIRQNLRTRLDWRRNPDRTNKLFFGFVGRLAGHIDLENKVVLDLGCGSVNALGMSSLFFLNGCRETYALDMSYFYEARCAVSLYEMLLECAALSGEWLVEDKNKDAFLSRLECFDLKILRQGRLSEGLGSAPLHLLSGDMTNTKIETGVDIMVSQAVLEHVMEFGHAARAMYEAMAPGGVAVHHVDLRDHRAFANPRKYHYWSFLSEGPAWTDGLCNRLRAVEIRGLFEAVGFEVVDFVGFKKTPPPSDLKRRLAEPYASMPMSEIELTGGEFVLRKPVG